jgi:hypothetical protein
MKNIILTLLFLSSLLANAQTTERTELVEVIRRWPNRADVTVTDGLIHKRTISDTSKTAFYFHTNGKTFIATTTFEEVGAPVIIPEDIDDRDARIAYVGNWDKTCCPAGSGHHDNTITFSGTKDNRFTLNFTGKSISWYVEVREHMGIAGVTFDNEPEQKVDLYSPTRGTQVKILTKSWATSSAHKVVVRVTGEKATASTGVFVVSDYFKIQK